MKEKINYSTGIYDISNDEYHGSHGISRTGIMEFKKSPKHFWHRYINPLAEKKVATPAMIFGSATHKFILENDQFLEEYFVPEKNPHHGNSTLGRKFKEDMLAIAEGKILLSKEDFDQITLMRNTLLDDENAKELISDAQYEKSIFWIDPDTGITCKVRPDIMHENFIVDLKTTNDASFRSFQRDFYAMGYHIQLAMIQEGIKHTKGKLIKNFIDLAIEKEQPFCHAIYQIDEAAIEQGLVEFKRQLFSIKECFENNYWPSYRTQTLSLPAYALNGE